MIITVNLTNNVNALFVIRIPIVPIKDANMECELSQRPSVYMDMDNVDEDLRIVSTNLATN